MASPDYDSIIAKLENAAASGLSSARDGDMSFQWRTSDELLALIAYWKGQRAAATQSGVGNTVIEFGRA